MRATFHKKCGAALVVTLCILVLLTVLVLAYFDRALLHRKISFSSAGQARAQTVALSAMEVITSDLRGEMLSGSTTNVISDVTIFTPTTNRAMVPSRMGSVAGMSNLVKWSAGGSNFWSAAAGYSSAGPVRAASGNSTVTPSANSRYIDAARWSLPQFGTNFTAVNTPSWILLSREGPLTNAAGAATELNVLGNSAATNARYVLGRFAYTIYDVGGLVDVAAAGYPAGQPLGVTARKGNLGYADLTQIGLTTTQVDTLTGWRNAGSLTNYPDYLKNHAAKYGFQRAAPGDQAFIGRQDFIEFWKSKLGADTSLLKYFTTYSREKNAPSFGPLQNASEWDGNNNGVNTVSGASVSGMYAYRDKANDEAAPNRFFPNVRVKTAFTRLDGKTAVPGEPLVKTRFDLSKLSWIRHDGTRPAGISDADINNYFGLQRNAAGSWVYNHGASERILTLEEVAAANREPDFFEILQAGILQGSLGLVSGDPRQQSSIAVGGEFNRLSTIGWQTTIVRSDAQGQLVYAREKYHVMQIGANLIDQADEDSFPTAVVLNGESFYGVENLPYINALADTALRPPPGGAIAPNDFQAYVHRWLTASLWNPHQNAEIAPADGPSRLRIYVGRGEGKPRIHNLGGALPGLPDRSARVFQPIMGGSTIYGPNTAGPGWIGLNIADYPGRFSEPTTISYDQSFTGAPGEDNINDPLGRIETSLGWKRAGIYMGWSYSPDAPRKVSLCEPLWPKPDEVKIAYCAAAYDWVMPLTVELQYEDGTAGWKTYQILRGLVPSRDGRGDPYMEPADPEWAKWTPETKAGVQSSGPLAMDQESWVLAFLDPRSPRLNMPARIGLKLDQTYLANNIDISYPVGPRFPKNPKLWQNWVNNSSVSALSYYTDRDGVRRVGDAAGWAGADPLVAGARAQRPLMLDRPFQSVGEIGYVFRDEPWKSLNFISSNSTDSGLLDLFCIGPAIVDKAAPAPEVVAGKVNINSAPEPILKALLSGVARDFQLNSPSNVNTTLSSAADIQSLVQSILTRVQSQGPFLNLAELPQIFPQDTSVSARNPGNKAQREAVIRALAGTTGTRTWNLMIDVIAQSGRFKQGAADLNDFVVEGEKRYWLHVAMDRFTGEIVDQTLEPVFEW